MDSLSIGQVTSEFMGQLEDMEGRGELPPGCVIGDVVLIAEIRTPEGSTIACRWSEPVRRHIVVGMLDSAMDMAKRTITG